MATPGKAQLTTDPTVDNVPAPSRSACPAALADLPELEQPREVAPLDARVLSRTLFARLGELAEGTAEYSYVRGTLVELNLSLVRYAAKRFGSSREPMEDIVQVGTVGLIKAIDRFDPGHGVEFTTFAMPTIVGEMKRFFRDTTWAAHVPRRLQELRLTVAKGGDKLEQRLGRAPTAAELGEHLSLSEAEVLDGITAGKVRTASSLEAQLDAEDTGASAMADRLGAQDPAFDRIEYIQALKPMIAELPARERLILSLRFCEDLTQSEIGGRLGLSQMHVSRLLSRSLAGLRSGLLA
ncbi:RNA polymerase sigma factor SigF [Kitasatospora sp. NPDC050543]|uniref:RNA polymerase sigma factor SigF n=1 Tax=Kitasatospora sp. NPDC050543 TaxID=3364054 RepID=UPI0037979CB5